MPGDLEIAANRRYTLGELAVFNKLMTSDQVEECLGIQKRLRDMGFPMPFAQICIEKFYLDQPSARALLRAQSSSSGEATSAEEIERIDIAKFTPAEHKILMERVRERNLVATERIHQALDIQVALFDCGIDKDLGEVFLERGDMKREEIADILAEHARSRDRLTSRIRMDRIHQDSPESPALPVPEDQDEVDLHRRFLFGAVAIDKEILTRDQVAHALDLQMRLKQLGILKRIGEVIAEKGILATAQVKRILALQKRMMGAMQWTQHHEMVPQSPDDEAFACMLADQDLLSPEQMRECLYVQKVYRDLGILRPLSRVVIDRDSLDRKVVASLLEELAAGRHEQAEGPPTDVKIAREVLSQAKIPARMYEESVETPFLDHDQAQAAIAARDERLAREVRRRRLWMGIGIALAIVTAAAVVYLLLGS